MHKFLLAENPQAPETGGLWIIHLPAPVAIIEVVLSGEKVHSKNAVHTANLQYRNSDGINEYWEFRLYHLFTTDFNLIDEQASKDMVNDLLFKAMHWYKAYLEWEDKNIDNEYR